MDGNCNIIDIQHQLESNFANMLDIMQLDRNDTNLKDTPERLAKSFVHEICRGLYCAEPKIKVFDNTQDYHRMVIVKDIGLHSLCAHHFQPFIGVVHIGYIPQQKVIGLSKFSRIVDYFARRPQIQENLTNQILNYIQDKVSTKDVVVCIKSEHFCMKLRGVQEHQSETFTCSYGGVFENDQTRREFFDYFTL